MQVGRLESLSSCVLFDKVLEGGGDDGADCVVCRRGASVDVTELDVVDLFAELQDSGRGLRCEVQRFGFGDVREGVVPDGRVVEAEGLGEVGEERRSLQF